MCLQGWRPGLCVGGGGGCLTPHLAGSSHKGQELGHRPGTAMSLESASRSARSGPALPRDACRLRERRGEHSSRHPQLPGPRGEEWSVLTGIVVTMMAPEPAGGTIARLPPDRGVGARGSAPSSISKRGAEDTTAMRVLGPHSQEVFEHQALSQGTGRGHRRRCQREPRTPRPLGTSQCW